MKKEPLYVFWRYDQPPYVLYGELLDFHPSGGAYVKGYDQNMTSYFRKESLLAVLPQSKARIYKEQLNIAMQVYEALIQTGRDRLEAVRNAIREAPDNQLTGL